MPTIAEIADFLERFAPRDLAEDWDNVGLLAGDRAQSIERVMTCLTITSASAAEAIERRVQLIVAHHPLPFRPLKRITTDTLEGDLLWRLLGAGIAIYSPHTSFDSTSEGINQRLAAGLGLVDIRVLVPKPADDGGAGRYGALARPATVVAVIDRVKKFLKVEQLQLVGDEKRSVTRVAVACGSGGEFLDAAREAGCEVLVTGEARFHTSLAAEAANVALVLAGHYATERFGVEHLAEVLAREFDSLDVWASRTERDPLRWY